MGETTTESPMCECVECGRKVQCVRVSDGTVYRPFAWKFPNPEQPLRGVCGACGAHGTTELK